LSLQQAAFSPAVSAFLSDAPQHDLPSSQQAAPSWQHVWAAEQQPFWVSQHLRPCSQQPSFLVAAQQALPPSEQQACFALQQSCFGAAAASPNAKPMSSTEPLANAFNMKTSKKSSELSSSS
jgi:hypothetical protein